MGVGLSPRRALRTFGGGLNPLDIRELARRLNVSLGPVSRALNDRADVSAETRRRVLEAATKLNYAPNQSGRSLRKGTTHAIAFLLQPHPGDHQYGEPFFVPFMKGLQAGLAESGLELIMVMDPPRGGAAPVRRAAGSRSGSAAWSKRAGRTRSSSPGRAAMTRASNIWPRSAFPSPRSAGASQAGRAIPRSISTSCGPGRNRSYASPRAAIAASQSSARRPS